MKPHERLDALMNERRLELGMRWNNVASDADISVAALRAIRNGDYRAGELTARHIEDALRWQHGSIQAVLDGGEPIPLELVSPQQPATDYPDDMSLTDEEKLVWQGLPLLDHAGRRRVLRMVRAAVAAEQQEKGQPHP